VLRYGGGWLLSLVRQEQCPHHRRVPPPRGGLQCRPTAAVPRTQCVIQPAAAASQIPTSSCRPPPPTADCRYQRGDHGGVAALRRAVQRRAVSAQVQIESKFNIFLLQALKSS